MQLLFQLLFFAAIAFIAGMCVFTVWYTNRHPLRPFARYLLLILIAMEIVLAALHMLQFYNTNMPGFWRWFFDLQYELNLGTIFSTVQLALIAGVALIIFFGLPEAKWWQRLYWLLLAAVFFYLMADEFYSFHETLLSRNPTEAWRVPYAIAGAILFGISALVFWFGYRKELPFFILLFAGLGVMTVSGIGIEEFVLRGFVAYDQRAEWMYIFEEIFEMVGATIVLANMLSFTQRHVTVSFWSRAWRFETVVGIISALWFTLSVLFAPAIEERLFATPVNIDYDNGLMTLVGYRMDTDKAVPGGDIPLTLYWRANKPLPEDYSLSVHLLRHNTTESIAQSDDLHAGPIPARAWFPGVVMRRTVYVPVPRSAPTPSTYDLMVRVWSGPWPFFTPWEDTVGLPVTQSESRPLFAYDAVVLDQVVAAPTDEIQTPETVADYEFPAEGFSIEGYDLPQEPVGRTVPVKFWWGTSDKTVNTDLTQFFHLQNADGELLTFDQQPFEGSFPTSDWPAEMQAEDEWTVTLPEDAPSGTYEVYTGLYNLETMQRSAITEGGEALPDGSIHLGQIVYDPAVDAAEAAALPDLSPYCFATSGADLRAGTKDNDLFRVDRETGDVTLIGRTGIYEAEELALTPDGRTLYTIEKTDLAQFGTLDLETGVFKPIGTAIATIDQPANNTALGTNILNGPDSLAVDPSTGKVWAVQEDDDIAKDFLFEIDPATGEVARNTFGPGNDYIHIDLSGIEGEYFYSDIEELAIDPRDGTFYIIASNDEDFTSVFARLDFDTLNTTLGTVQPVVIGLIHTDSGAILHDMEGMSFYNDGTLYGVTSNNTGSDDSNDSFWEIDPETASARFITNFRDFYEASDFEGVACYTGATAGE